MLLAFFVQLFALPLAWLEPLYLRMTRLPQSSLIIVAALGVTRSKPELLIQNAFLRQQLLILQRQVNKPRLTRPSVFLSCSSLATCQPGDNWS